MNEEFKGELLGFSFNNVHSSELGIVRIIQGNRVNDSAPSHKDIVVDIPGAIGSYYYGTIINKKDIVINYAFDNVSEEQLLRIKTIFSDKLPHKLIFDEEPDAYYMARVSGSAQLKHLCFLEDGKRVYKGEGSLTFTCDYPFKIRQRTSSYDKKERISYVFKFDYDFSGVISINCAEERSLQIKIRKTDKDTYLAYNFTLSNKTYIDLKKRIIYDKNGILSLKKLGAIDWSNLNLTPGEWAISIFDLTEGNDFPILHVKFDFYETIEF